MNEIWRETVDYDGYEVSNLGNVRSTTRKRRSDNSAIVLTQKLSMHGYPRVRLTVNKKRKPVPVHKLVATAFIPKPEWAECINHKNGDKTDNRVENLEWSTYQKNNLHALETGLRKMKGKKVEVIKPSGEKLLFKNRTECGKYFGFGYSWVKDRIKKHGKEFRYNGHLIRAVD